MIAGHTYAIVGKLVSGSVEYSGNSVYPALYREGTATSEVLTTNANGTNYHARAFISEGYTDLLWVTIVSGTVCNNAVYEYTITDTTQPTSEGLYIADSSATPTINAVPNGRYVCTASAVTELSFTPSASGICSIRFKSGTTHTVLNIPNTVKMPDWWTGCESNYTYEIKVKDGTVADVSAWPDTAKALTQPVERYLSVKTGTVTAVSQNYVDSSIAANSVLWVYPFGLAVFKVFVPVKAALPTSGTAVNVGTVSVAPLTTVSQTVTNPFFEGAVSVQIDTTGKIYVSSRGTSKPSSSWGIYELVICYPVTPFVAT
jgi:hypothetical protein